MEIVSATAMRRAIFVVSTPAPAGLATVVRSDIEATLPISERRRAREQSECDEERIRVDEERLQREKRRAPDRDAVRHRVEALRFGVPEKDDPVPAWASVHRMRRDLPTSVALTMNARRCARLSDDSRSIAAALLAR